MTDDGKNISEDREFQRQQQRRIDAEIRRIREDWRLNHPAPEIPADD